MSVACRGPQTAGREQRMNNRWSRPPCFLLYQYFMIVEEQAEALEAEHAVDFL
jgi:hypothetical protein